MWLEQLMVLLLKTAVDYVDAGFPIPIHDA